MAEPKRRKKSSSVGDVLVLAAAIAKDPAKSAALTEAAKSGRLRVTVHKPVVARLAALTRDDPDLAEAAIPVTDPGGAFGGRRRRAARTLEAAIPVTDPGGAFGGPSGRPSVSLGDVFALLTRIADDPAKASQLEAAAKSGDLRMTMHEPTVAFLRELTRDEPRLAEAAIPVTDPWGAFG